MNSRFCSILAAKEGEPVDGTAPEKDSAIFLPEHKGDWHRASAKEKLEKLSKDSDLGHVIASFKNPLIIFYSPNERARDYIFVSDSSGIQCFSSSGLRIENDVKRLYAVCTDGVKDACCAKFGIPVSKAFSKQCAGDKFSLSLETSHIGGCRFAATAICFPSGNSYGRIFSETVCEIKRSEENGLIVSKIFRGNIFVSEIHCWIMRHSMENFGYVPTPDQTNVVKDKNSFHITITPEQKPEFKFDLLHEEVEFMLFSGCSNVDSLRSIARSTYNLAQSNTV